MFSDEVLIGYLSLLEKKLLEDYDIVVDYIENSSGNYYYYEEGIIEIGQLQSLIGKLYSLLHEAGHVILSETEFFTLRKSNLKRYRRSYRVNVLREEFMAWERGRNYGYEIGIQIDPKVWEKHRVESLFKYIVWANDPINYKPPK